MREAGELDAPVPSADWVAFQFRPRRPTSGVAQRYTGRWAIKLQVPSYTLKCPHHPSPADCSRCSRPPPRRKVLQMTLRKHHPDGHWCNASEKNIKGFIREFDDRFMADMKRLSDLRSDMERLLEVMSRLPSESTAIGDARDHSSSEREAEQLALKVGHLAALAFKYRGIPANDLKGWLSGEASVRIARMSDDTKCKVPVGEPGARVSTNVRPSGPSPAHLSVVLAALDHGWHRASITPSVTLRSSMPELSDPNQSWRRGPLSVQLYDSTFQGASAFRNAAEMRDTIRRTCSFASGGWEAVLPPRAAPIVIVKRTDGGPEQNMKNGSVQLADIALLRTSGADLCVHSRPAPDNSWVNDVEGCMPVLNLGLQHMALEREKMDEQHEELLKNAGSMRKTREAIQAIEAEDGRAAARAAWAASMAAVINELQERFSRLFYNQW